MQGDGLSRFHVTAEPAFTKAFDQVTRLCFLSKKIFEGSIQVLSKKNKKTNKTETRSMRYIFSWISNSKILISVQILNLSTFRFE